MMQFDARQTPGMNPFLPFAAYIPDGEPKVFGDRLYLYGSWDLFGSGYCCGEYRVFSAPLSDLTAWEDHGVSFSSADVPWSDALLYAPDVLAHAGKYYLYFCLSDGSEGVAESDAPTGPFGNARRITLGGEPISGIDPSVLDADGHIYYTWGQFHLQMAELGPDLCTLRPETLHTDVLSNAPGREGFHEGSSLRRIGDRFCLIYASEYKDAPPNSGARPTKLDYAISVGPYGPYERRGTVIDNTGCDPASWNDHGSVICADGQWYVFYHASTNNCAFSRRARVERLTVDPASCTIRQATPSSNGFLETLYPEQLRSPVHACCFFGGAFLTETPDGRFACTALRTGAGFEFSPCVFEAGRYRLALRYQAASQARLQVFLGDDMAAEACLPPQTEWGEAELELPAAAGPAAMRLEITEAAENCLIDALTLCKTE